MAGYTEGDLGGHGQGPADAYLARYDAEGNRAWITQFGTIESDVAMSLATDGAGGVLVAGQTSGDLGGPNAGSVDIFLARFDADGHQVWASQFGGSDIEMDASVAEDGAGGAFVAGRTRGLLVCRQGGDDDAFLAHYNAAGELVHLVQMGTQDGDYFTAVVADGAGGVVIGGVAGEAFDGLAPGGGGMFIARFGVDPCPADLDGSGTLNLFDFLAFVSLFNAGNQDADRDNNCVYELFDFLAFLNEFNAGC